MPLLEPRFITRFANSHSPRPGTCARTGRPTELLLASLIATEVERQQWGQCVATPDLIRDRLAQPMDWGRFEELACQILFQDDMPALRRLGGGHDLGMDAVEESYYQNERATHIVVQITSEKTQINKFLRTVKRLHECDIQFSVLVMVYRAPVSSPVRLELQAKAAEMGFALDVRDESYLVQHLASTRNGIFRRFFAADLRAQLLHFVDETDAPVIGNDRLGKAVLAALGAYVINPRARVVRHTLFDRTVVASLVAANDSGRTAEDVSEELRTLLPGEATTEQVRASLDRLKREGQCVRKGTLWRLTPEALEECSGCISVVQRGLDELLSAVVGGVSARASVDDATLGRLERNVREMLTFLFRSLGPLAEVEAEALEEISSGSTSLLAILAKQVDPTVARVALLTLADYVKDPAHTGVLSVLARTYASLAVRNMDPLGKRWQHAILGRSEILLDTDAVLRLIVSDLPEHDVLVSCCQALLRAGVVFRVPNIVLDEASGHIGRAYKTFCRFEDRLLRLPSEAVDNQVWHAVVRGFYYYIRGIGKRSATRRDFDAYLRNYVDSDPRESRAFINRLLSSRIQFELMDPPDVRPEEMGDFEAVADTILKLKERKRKKAQFRDDPAMQLRVDEDIQFAFAVARIAVDSKYTRHGYIVSSDSAFWHAQRLIEWRGRPKIHIQTRAMPFVGEFICGEPLHEDQLVRLMFDPLIAAAADHVAADLDALANVGVDVTSVSFERLKWDTEKGLKGALVSYKETRNGEGRLSAALDLVIKADALGYDLDGALTEAVGEGRRLQEELDDERIKRAASEAISTEALDRAVLRLEKVLEAKVSKLERPDRRRLRRLLRDVALAETPDKPGVDGRASSTD